MQIRMFKLAYPLLKKTLDLESSNTLDIIKTTVQKLNYKERLPPQSFCFLFSFPLALCPTYSLLHSLSFSLLRGVGSFAQQ